MSNLVIADHNNTAISASTLVAIAAAKAIGGDIDLLVAGAGCAAAGEAAGRLMVSVKCLWPIMKFTDISWLKTCLNLL